MQVLTARIQQHVSFHSIAANYTIEVDSRGALGDAWDALVALKQAQTALNWLASELFPTVFKGLLESAEPLSISDNSAEMGTTLRLHIYYEAPPPIRSREAGIVHCLDFVQGQNLLSTHMGIYSWSLPLRRLQQGLETISVRLMQIKHIR